MYCENNVSSQRTLHKDLTRVPTQTPRPWFLRFNDWASAPQIISQRGLEEGKKQKQKQKQHWDFEQDLSLWPREMPGAVPWPTEICSHYPLMKGEFVGSGLTIKMNWIECFIEIIRFLLSLKEWEEGEKREERKVSRSGRGRGWEWKKKDGREENKTRQRFPIFKLTSITATKLSVISVHKSNIVFLTSIVAVWKQLKFPTSFSHSFRKRQDISN